jgi:hypothetical protein
VEKNVKKIKVVRISRQLSPIQILINQNQPENVKHSIYLSTMITDDARSTSEIHSGIDIAKVVFNKMKPFFTSKMDLKLKEEITPYICTVSLCCVEIQTLQKVVQQYLKWFAVWCWRWMEISWTDRLRNEKVHEVKEEINSYIQCKEERLT